MAKRSLNAKLMGEQAELAFMHEASKRGFFIAKPYGDTLPYDVLLDATAYNWRCRPIGRVRLLRIQVKSGTVLNSNAYRVSGRGSRYTYSKRDFDFLVAWVRPLDTWYIIPVRALRGKQRLALYPHVEGHRGWYERFRGRWDLLRGSKPQRTQRRTKDF